MAQSIMVLATEPGTGKSVLALGLADQLERQGVRAAYFKPVAMSTRKNGTIDPDVLFVHKALDTQIEPKSMIATTSDEVRAAVQAGRYDGLLDQILEAHSRLAERADVLICEGVDSLRAFPSLESDINVDIAKNIESPIVLVTSGRDLTGDEILANAKLTCQGLTERGAEVLGVLVNRVDERRHGDLADGLRRTFADNGPRLLGVLPDLAVLSRPRLTDVVRALDAKVIFGEAKLDVRIGRVLVAAMGLENALHYFDDNCLVIAPGDREEILLAAAAAYVSPAVPQPAGVLLTGGFEPRRKVMQLVHSLTQENLPILRVEQPTYDTAIRVNRVGPSLDERQEDKALAIRHAMEEYVDLSFLLDKRVAPARRVVTPKRFLRDLRQKARAQKQTIVLPESEVDRILQAADELRRKDIVNLILIGDDTEVRKRAQTLGVTLDQNVSIVNPQTDPSFDDYVKTLVELRKHKALPEEVARDLMRDRTYFGTMMVYKGRAQGMVSGATTTTQATLRPAFEFVRTREGFQSVSSIFFMCLPDRVLVYGDCAVIPKPTVEQLAEIALASADTAKAFGIEPRVAMLSYSTGTSGAGADVDFVRQATDLVRLRNPNLSVEGPIQYDAAIDPGVAKTKLPNSKVAGQATVFIFPDLNTGNNTYKAVQRSSGAIAIGPVLQGLRKPVNDLSRGASVTDIVNTVVVTAIQAQALAAGGKS